MLGAGLAPAGVGVVNFPPRTRAVTLPTVMASGCCPPPSEKGPGRFGTVAALAYCSAHQVGVPLDMFSR